MVALFFHGWNVLQSDHTQLLAIGRAAGFDLAAGTVNRAGTVKGVNGLAVVLQADVVHVEQGFLRIPGLLAEYPVALIVFSQGIGRGGDIDEEVSSLFRQQLDGSQFIIITPAVLAEQTAGSIGFPFAGKADRTDELIGGGAQFPGQLLHVHQSVG